MASTFSSEATLLEGGAVPETKRAVVVGCLWKKQLDCTSGAGAKALTVVATYRIVTILQDLFMMQIFF
jgi:hypothetical protein